MPGPKLVPLLLTDAEREALGSLARKRTASQSLAERARIVLVTRTLTGRGRGEDTPWSTRTMAAETGRSQSSVSRIWRTFGLKPQLVET